MISQMASIYASEAIKGAMDKVEVYIRSCSELAYKGRLSPAADQYFAERESAAMKWLEELRDLHKRIVRQEV